MEKKLGLESYEVSLDVAQKRAMTYRGQMARLINNYNEKYPEEKISTEFVKGFWLPIDDIECLLKMVRDMKIPDVDGVRVYLGVAKDAAGKDAVAVTINATQGDGEYVHNDIIFEKEGVTSGIYDFSQSCPTYCDRNSPLFAPILSDLEDK